ncbi:extradiol dioxygenase [Ectopseudomonas composti]|uniref:Extradiol dioxygenase n=1 Tax=Ectopseudomonas composti TaxID=658457 RepID=A0ABP3BSU2_9GAMM|nr:VOC family protein [Pseudomonas composti]EZH77867.1 extradiol dioxygenase [Pseudomonas composti]
MSGIDTLGYIGFTARDISAWKTFAPEVLGLQIAQELEDGSLVLRADLHQRRIIIHPGERDDIAYVGWECRSSGDLNQLRDALRAAQVPFDEVERQTANDLGVREMIRFHDLDGVLIEAHYGPTLLANQPFVSPVGARPFVTQEQGLGHLVLATGRYQQQINFYEQVLRFKRTDSLIIPGINAEAMFLRVNERHHSLAIVDMPPTHGPRLHHILLEVSSLDEVGFAYTRAKAAGAHILIDLGRHVNDNMFSFYVLTPSGWSVEIGWGGIQIDDETWHVTHYPTNSSWGHEFHMPPAFNASK